MVSIVLSVCTKSPISQVIPAAASLLYGVWYAYIVYDSFCVNVDAQSAIVLVFVGIYALPVLLPLWLAAIVVDIRHRNKQDGLPPLF
ncbi:MAG: hypothetical protein LBI05_05055 [Planctomycetaceae bacterium]|nr:hypothetical protein [Planctomycetaceae bacterium]